MLRRNALAIAVKFGWTPPRRMGDIEELCAEIADDE